MIGWLDAGAGASGDMLLGALVDAGTPLAHLQSTVDAVFAGSGPPPLRLRAEQVVRHGLGATLVRVDSGEAGRHLRTLPDIEGLLVAADLPRGVATTALAAFTLLAEAEGAVHRIDPREVHFHEVGALDAIADIVGACAGVQWLRGHLGLARLLVGTVEVGGGGSIRAAHGTLPAPAPAVLEIARLAGLAVRGGLPYEACTPTGAALLATLPDGQGPMPILRPVRVGLGAGVRDPDDAANVLRLVLGEATTVTPAEPEDSPAESPDEPGAEPAVHIECNVDDLDPRLWPAALAALLDAGVSDAWLAPILMKKGRPAHTLHALCPPEATQAARDAIYAHTSTIGLREATVTKTPLDRHMSTVDVDGQEVRVKVARRHGKVVNVSVEYEDVVRAAQALGRPTRIVLARAAAEADRRYGMDLAAPGTSNGREERE